MTKLLLLIAAGVALWMYLKQQKQAKRPRMPQDEARAVLGVGPQANAAEIRDAHRRLVSAVHPDKGGSAELTRRINIARDTLLKQ